MEKQEDIAATQGTSQKEGLSSREAARRLAQYGPNEFAERKRLRPVFILLSKFRNPLLILLVAAALVSGVLGSRFEAGVILAIVLGSALIDFTNTYRSAKAAEALREKVTVTAAVLRDGKLEERHVHEIVPGDVVALEAGDIVPADGVVFEAKDLFVDESMLTGESVPVEKEAVAGDARLVFMESSVVSGKGFMVVAATGARTRVGGIADQAETTGCADGIRKKSERFQFVHFSRDVIPGARRDTPEHHFQPPGPLADVPFRRRDSGRSYAGTLAAHRYEQSGEGSACDVARRRHREKTCRDP